MKKIFYQQLSIKILFCSAVLNDRYIGTQFHPEKSGDIGLEFLAKQLKTLHEKNFSLYGLPEEVKFCKSVLFLTKDLILSLNLKILIIKKWN